VWVFAITDLKIRYKNSVLGILWSFLEPLSMLAVLYFIFNYVFPSKIPHYPLYLLLGLITWNYFTRGTSAGMNSIQARKGLIVTISFPKITLPVGAVVTSSLMMCFELLVFGFFMVLFQFIPPITILLFPIFLFFVFLLNVGIALPLSIASIKYKDIGYIWQVITYAGFFLTPVIYNLDVFPAQTRSILLINPMAQIIKMSHDAVLYGISPYIQDVIYTGIISIMVFLVGLTIFMKKERIISDDL